MKEMTAGLKVDAAVIMPGSKSITHRALIAAGLARGESQIRSCLRSEDTLYTASALQQLGVEISFEGDDAVVSGTGGGFTPALGKKELYVGNSGTSFRLLMSAAALAHGEYTLTGSERMCQRPVAELLKALRALGVKAYYTDRVGFPPVRIKANGIRGGRVEISGGVSSQYISSLLLSAPYTREGVEIEVGGALVSRPYVDLTVEVMEYFGVAVLRDGYRRFRVEGDQHYRPGVFTVEGDVSAASYFWAAAAVTGRSIATLNINPLRTRQGDMALLSVLEEMGCRVIRETDRVMVYGGALWGADLDMSMMPDMVPTVAAIALFARGTTHIRNVGHLRHKESDRLHTIAKEWTRLGAAVTELADGLIIHGQGRLSGVGVDPHNDHRLAMALAVVGLQVPGLRIGHGECVGKSFPGFWSLWGQISGKFREDALDIVSCARGLSITRP